ncbi:phage integrase N-terminal SAM-like domain-containing protein [Dehalococcoidia bacterium]|nr:phage integrase N-terminal SAM-like domain-containing protein [Dehalococcoidia bacterium]
MAVCANLIQIEPGEAERLKLLIPYDATWVAKVKAIPGHRWHPKEKCWSVPRSENMVERLVSLFGEEQVKVEPSLRPLKDSLICQGEDPQLVQLLEAMDQELRLHGYAAKTRKAYLGHVDRFARFYGNDPQGLSKVTMRAYLLHLLQK